MHRAIPHFSYHTILNDCFSLVFSWQVGDLSKLAFLHMVVKKITEAYHVSTAKIQYVLFWSISVQVKSFPKSLQMSSFIHLQILLFFLAFLSISLSSASRLQPRHTGGWRGKALLALPSSWPIRRSGSGHHPLPLRCPFPAVRHHPLHLPAQVRRTGRPDQVALVVQPQCLINIFQ